MSKKTKKLKEVQESLANPNARNKDKSKLEKRLKEIIAEKYINDVIEWSLIEGTDKSYQLSFSIPLYYHITVFSKFPAS